MMTDGPPEYQVAKQLSEKVGTNTWLTSESILSKVNVDTKRGIIAMAVRDLAREGALEEEQRGARNHSGVPVESYRLCEDWEEHVAKPEPTKRQDVRYWGETDNEQDTFSNFV